MGITILPYYGNIIVAATSQLLPSWARSEHPALTLILDLFGATALLSRTLYNLASVGAQRAPRPNLNLRLPFRILDLLSKVI